MSNHEITSPPRMPYTVGNVVYFDQNEFEKNKKEHSDLKIGEVVGGYYLKKFSCWWITIKPDYKPNVTVDVHESMITQIIMPKKEGGIILAKPKIRKNYTKIAGLLQR